MAVVLVVTGTTNLNGEQSRQGDQHEPVVARTSDEIIEGYTVMAVAAWLIPVDSSPVPVAMVAASPTILESVVSSVPGSGASGIIGQWLRGYREAGGRREWEGAFLLTIGGPTPHCPTGESNWDRYALSSGGHLGLGQFHPASWAGAGGGDWTDAYTQGRNTAYWSSVTVPSEQWSCWPWS